MSPTMPDLPIELRHVSKAFHVRDREQRLGFLGDSTRRSRSRLLQALDDVSFTVERGEMLGVVGLNGSGKSTLLKVLADITPPSSGEVSVRGRVGSLIELGAGFHMELSGLENVYLNGTILGIERDEIERRLPDIIEYSGLERFMDMAVKHYSSGMQMRLGFAIAIQLRPDILLLDETMSTGDAAFQPKALKTVLNFKERGITILMVSHEIHAVREYCDRVLWLDHGRVRALGSAEEVCNAYRDFFVSRFSEESALVTALHGDRLLSEPTADDSPIEIGGLSVDGATNGHLDMAAHDTIILRIPYRRTRPVDRVRVAVVALFQSNRAVALDRDSERDGCPITDLAERGTIALELHVPEMCENDLCIAVALYAPDDPDHALARSEMALHVSGHLQPIPDIALSMEAPCQSAEIRPLLSEQ